MSIQVVCPNGHPLTIDDSCAGKIGLCPVCKAPVKVPQTDNRPVSEDAGLDFLAVPEPKSSRAIFPRSATADRAETVKYTKKRCTHCQREVIASLSVCPYCHGQFAAASPDPGRSDVDPG